MGLQSISLPNHNSTVFFYIYTLSFKICYLSLFPIWPTETVFLLFSGSSHSPVQPSTYLSQPGSQHRVTVLYWLLSCSSAKIIASLFHYLYLPLLPSPSLSADGFSDFSGKKKNVTRCKLLCYHTWDLPALPTHIFVSLLLWKRCLSCYPRLIWNIASTQNLYMQWIPFLPMSWGLYWSPSLFPLHFTTPSRI